jgi:hypothetical protein
VHLCRARCWFAGFVNNVRCGICTTLESWLRCCVGYDRGDSNVGFGSECWRLRGIRSDVSGVNDIYDFGAIFMYTE